MNMRQSSFFRLIIFTETVLGIILFINSEFSFIDILQAVAMYRRRWRRLG